MFIIYLTKSKVNHEETKYHRFPIIWWHPNKKLDFFKLLSLPSTPKCESHNDRDQFNQLETKNKDHEIQRLYEINTIKSHEFKVIIYRLKLNPPRGI